MSLHESMGGYGDYVWSAYGFTVVLLGGLMVRAALLKKRVLKKLRQRK